MGHLARDCRSARNGNVNRGIERENIYNRNYNNRYDANNNDGNMNNGYRRKSIIEITYTDPQVGCEQSWRANAVGPRLILAVQVAAT